MPWSVEATRVVRRATSVAAATKARVAQPIHLLLALAEGADAVGEALSKNGSIDAPSAGPADSLRLPQVEGAAEHFALEQGQSVLPAHLLVALLDQGDADVRQALVTNDLDLGSLRRTALRAIGAPEDLPPLVMPDLRWGPL
ncbi:MAG TPA: Clp protease N-terminal domain-containing protein [Acidimicrobiales bacterium]|nr:Clp protease N-terminal domain-containing protein [Acidimicrobiales bacterium]